MTSILDSAAKAYRDVMDELPFLKECQEPAVKQTMSREVDYSATGWHNYKFKAAPEEEQCQKIKKIIDK